MSHSQRPKPTIATVMTPFPQSVTPATTIADAQALMDENGFRHLPVIRDREVVGLLSSRDLDVVRLLSALEKGGSDEPTYVKELCNGPVFVVDLHAPLAATMRAMAEKQFGSAVVQREGNLAGIITTVDICRAFADYLEPPADDDQVA